MAAKVVKLVVVPAALGLASFRVYAMTEEKMEGHIAPRELSIYSAAPPALRYVEEKPGHLQTGLGQMRERFQACVTAVQNTCTSVKVGAVSLYQAGQDTYNFLKDPPPGFLPRVGIITVSGLAGLVLARKGSRLKRICVPAALTAAGAAVCYPMHTVRVLKVTGKKLYAAGSLVASAFKSKPKEDGTAPDASPERKSEEVCPEMKVAPQPDEVPEKVPSLPEGDSVSEASSVTEEVVAPVPEVSPAPDVAPVSEDSPAVDAGTQVTPASLVVDIAQAEAVDLTPVPDLAPDDVIPSGVEIPPTDTVAPQEKPTPAESAPLAVEETTPPSLHVKEAKPPPVKEEPRFVPDPSLLDHGQAHPEDADMYSTRG